MPFPEQSPRAFTRAGIEVLSVGQKGCYGIFKSGQWIYIGKGDIRERLLSHVNGDNPCIAWSGATHYVAAVTANMDALEKSLILEHTPSCNQRVG